MDKILKQKWVEALRSGLYQQARGKLRDECGRLCCLGVLRELVEPGSNDSMSGNNSMPTDGFTASVGAINYDHAEIGTPCFAQLAEMNDAGKSFAEIADVIERKF